MTVFSVVLAIVSIALAFFFWFRPRWKRGEMVFVAELVIPLFDEIVKEIPDLEIKLKGEAVGQNLVFFRGFLVNTGPIDARIDATEKPVALQLSEGSKWIEFKLLSTPCGSAVVIDAPKANELEIKMNLFKAREMIQFTALAEIPAVENGSEPVKCRFKNEVRAVARIADFKTPQVVFDYFPYRKTDWAVLFSFLVLFVPYMGWVVQRASFDDERVFRFMRGPGEITEVTYEPDADDPDYVKLTGIDAEFEQTVKREDFLLSAKETEHFVKRVNWFPLVVLTFTFLVILSVLLRTFWMGYKNSRISGLLNEDQKNRRESS